MAKSNTVRPSPILDRLYAVGCTAVFLLMMGGALQAAWALAAR